MRAKGGETTTTSSTAPVVGIRGGNPFVPLVTTDTASVMASWRIGMRQLRLCLLTPFLSFCSARTCVIIGAQLRMTPIEEESGYAFGVVQRVVSASLFLHRVPGTWVDEIRYAKRVIDECVYVFPVGSHNGPTINGSEQQRNGFLLRC